MVWPLEGSGGDVLGWTGSEAVGVAEVSVVVGEVVVVGGRAGRRGVTAVQVARSFRQKGALDPAPKPQVFYSYF